MPTLEDELQALRHAVALAARDQAAVDHAQEIHARWAEADDDERWSAETLGMVGRLCMEKSGAGADNKLFVDGLGCGTTSDGTTRLTSPLVLIADVFPGGEGQYDGLTKTVTVRNTLRPFSPRAEWEGRRRWRVAILTVGDWVAAATVATRIKARGDMERAAIASGLAALQMRIKDGGAHAVLLATVVDGNLMPGQHTQSRMGFTEDAGRYALVDPPQFTGHVFLVHSRGYWRLVETSQQQTQDRNPPIDHTPRGPWLDVRGEWQQ